MQTGMKKKQGSIVDILKEEILSGRIPGGTEMTQNELAASLGVSRMPVREALIVLEYQGLIRRLPNNHVQVSEFADEYFEEIFELCAALEATALENGFVYNGAEKISRFEERVPEEMLIHRQISLSISNAFLKKTLDTIFEIYIDYALHCASYDSEAGVKVLKEALAASPKMRRQALEQYFEKLEEAVLKERKKEC